MPKVLIATSWWPSKSNCWEKYSKTIAGLLDSPGIEAQHFITTSYAVSKYRSIVTSMAQASEWAIEHGFTHLLNIEADRAIANTDGVLVKMLSHQKPVLIATVEGGTGVRRMNTTSSDSIQGWGLMLVDVDVLRKTPFQLGFAGDYVSPDRSWYKKLTQDGVGIWITHEVEFELLAKPDIGPREGFQARGVADV